MKVIIILEELSVCKNSKALSQLLLYIVLLTNWINVLKKNIKNRKLKNKKYKNIKKSKKCTFNIKVKM